MVPSAWAGGFPSLSQLVLGDLPLHGSLPVSWGNSGALPSLSLLHIASDLKGVSQLSGTLPSEWGNPGAFQHLQSFGLSFVTMTGGPAHSTLAPLARRSLLDWH